MIKVFSLNKNGKIEITQKELQKLLDDSYWEGYRANTGTYVYTSPTWRPWTVTCDSITCRSSNAGSSSVTLNNSCCDGGSTPTSTEVKFCLNDFATAYATGEIKNEI